MILLLVVWQTVAQRIAALYKSVEISFDLMVLWGAQETGVFLEHGGDVGQAVGVPRELVAALGAVHAFSGDLALPLSDELVADFAEHRHDDLVEEMMALDIHVGVVGRDA